MITVVIGDPAGTATARVSQALNKRLMASGSIIDNYVDAMTISSQYNAFSLVHCGLQYAHTSL